jgi:hypothetical protein
MGDTLVDRDNDTVGSAADGRRHGIIDSVTIALH